MTVQLAKIYNFVREFYSLDELRTLCFELGIEFENLGGRTRNAKSRELILQLGQQRRLDDLLKALQTTRRNIFAKAQIDSSKAGLDQLYGELDAFEETTRPLAEKILSRVGLEQRVGVVHHDIVS